MVRVVGGLDVGWHWLWPVLIEVFHLGVTKLVFQGLEVTQVCPTLVCPNNYGPQYYSITEPHIHFEQLKLVIGST